MQTTGAKVMVTLGFGFWFFKKMPATLVKGSKWVLSVFKFWNRNNECGKTMIMKLIAIRY